MQKSDEDKLAAEIERVRKEGRKELEAEQERVRILLAKEKEQMKVNNGGFKHSVGEEPTKIKVRWKAGVEWKESERTLYTAESLKTIFSKYGDVNVVVVSGASNARKGKRL